MKLFGMCSCPSGIGAALLVLAVRCVSGLRCRKGFPWRLALLPDYTFNFLSCAMRDVSGIDEWSHECDFRDFRLWFYLRPQATGDIFGNDVIEHGAT